MKNTRRILFAAAILTLSAFAGHAKDGAQPLPGAVSASSGTDPQAAMRKRNEKVDAKQAAMAFNAERALAQATQARAMSVTRALSLQSRQIMPDDYVAQGE